LLSAKRASKRQIVPKGAKVIAEIATTILLRYASLPSFSKYGRAGEPQAAAKEAQRRARHQGFCAPDAELN
jgi:hypothetical protein